MRDPFCPAAHSDGWLCVLAEGHEGPHLSLDNRARWRGTVGKPVRWRAQIQDLPDLPDRPRVPEQLALMPAGKDLGYTGIPCDACGSVNTVRVGKCLRCDNCQTAGECG